MRIDVGVAVAGEVFPGGEEPRRSRATDVRARQAAHELWILSEGACVDDRIERIGVNVEHRSEDQVNADRAGFGAEHLAQLVGEIFRAGSAKRHDWRKDSTAALGKQ